MPVDERLTRADLRGFDGHAKDLILWAQAKGARIKISKRGHAIVRYRNRSTSVARNLKMQTRTAQNSRSAVKRLFSDKRPDVVPGERNR